MVSNLSRIVVIDAGCVRAVGTHAELLGTDPLYAELAATSSWSRPTEHRRGHPRSSRVDPRLEERSSAWFAMLRRLRIGM